MFALPWRTHVRQAHHRLPARSRRRGRRGPPVGERAPARHYTVQPGDTLWSIAAEHGRGRPRKAVWSSSSATTSTPAAAAGRRHRPPVAGQRGGARRAREGAANGDGAVGAARSCAERRSAKRSLDSPRGSRPRFPRHLRVDADRAAGPVRAAPATGRGAAARRLRRGHAAATAPLECRPGRPARGLPHALPRRPLPRPARE